MAKSDSAVMDPETGEVVTPESTPKKSKPGIFAPLPDDLIKAIKDRGESENKPDGRVVAEAVAQAFGYALPPLDRARRGGADTTGLTQKAKSAAIIKLIELADQGLIELTPDLKLLLGRA